MSTGSWVSGGAWPWQRLFRDRTDIPPWSSSTPGPWRPASPCLPTGQRTESLEQGPGEVRLDPRAAVILAGGAACRSRPCRRVVHRHRRVDRAAAALGDQRWRRLLDRHDRVARAEVERCRGRLVTSTGDGVLATCDAPTRARCCAFGLTAGLGDVGLGIRSRIHTGEIEVPRRRHRRDRGAHRGSGLAHAGDREVLVTRTVRDLVTGPDLAFSPAGAVGLRGIPGEWELFAASAGRHR
jgi:hypothetical protein